MRKLRSLVLLPLVAVCFGAMSVGAYGRTQTGVPAKTDNPPTLKLTVLVDGKPVEFKDAAPQVLMGRTMVPMRGIFEAIGAYVEYDDANHTIKAQKNNESVDLRLGSRIAKKNGAEILMEVKPQLLGGTTMVPLRFIAEALDAKVEFDKANNRINVTTSS